jgi:hypothetical protein
LSPYTKQTCAPIAIVGAPGYPSGEAVAARAARGRARTVGQASHGQAKLRADPERGGSVQHGFVTAMHN